jgi:hypothetical protein
MHLSNFSLLLTPGERQVHEWNGSRCHVTLLESHTIVFHNFHFVTFNFLKTCSCFFNIPTHTHTMYTLKSTKIHIKNT